MPKLKAVPVLSGLIILLIIVFLPATGLDAAPAAQTASFSFTAAGDYGEQPSTDAVLSAMGTSGARFNLALGDLSYADPATSPETAWCDRVKSKVGANFPFELVPGNHDSDIANNGHIDKFALCLPDRMGNLTGTYGKEYYFDVNNLARFILISPNLRLGGQKYDYVAGNAHYLWLANAIDGARSANLLWVIVGMHKNCITTGHQICEIGPDLMNLLIAKKVDLVLQGHDHNYQRSKQLAFQGVCTSILPNAYDANCVVGDGATGAYTKGKGMVLVIAGTGGKQMYVDNPGDQEAGYFAKITAPGQTLRHGFLQVQVSSTQLKGQFVPATAGTFTDAFTVGSAAPTTTPLPSGTATVRPSATRTPTVTSTPITVAPTPTPKATGNLLINPGFELDTNHNNSPDSWTTAGGRFTTNSQVIHSGSFAGKLFDTADSTFNVSQSVNVSAGSHYQFSGWVNIPPTGDVFALQLQVHWLGAGGVSMRTETLKTFTAPTNGWTFFTGATVAPAGATTARTRVKAVSLNGTIFVDDFAFGP